MGDGPRPPVMDVWWISPGGPPKRHGVDDLAALLDRDGGGFCWVDVPHCDDRSAGVLAEVFGAHPLAVRDCVEANSTGKVHAYPDHVLLVLHSPEPGQGGQAHLVELDQLVSTRYLVTVHGPFPPGLGRTWVSRVGGAGPDGGGPVHAASLNSTLYARAVPRPPLPRHRLLPGPAPGALAAMGGVSFGTLHWARRQGWW